MPANTVYVGRGSKWGNPFKVISKKTGGYEVRVGREIKLYGWRSYALEESIEQYKNFISNKTESGELHILELKGKNLACWCPLDQPCHADVLLEIANVYMSMR